MYGWKPKESLGKSSHQLLRTIFPKSLQSIEAELNRTGRWEGELLHKRRDGSPVVVASRWELQRNALDNSTTVIEINSERPRAD
jgi:PAS domain-containing protein